MSELLIASSFGFPNWILFLLSLVFIYFLFHLWKNSKTGKFIWHRIILIIPVFGNLSRKVVLAKFTRGLSTLVNSGVSIVKAIKITSGLVGNEFYKRRILKIADDVQQGVTIADNIKNDRKSFPVMLTSMVEVGEQTAQLGEVCEKVAEFYEDEVDNIVKNLSSLMEPMIIIIIGFVVGFLVIAIMSPIMSMSETISG